MAAKKRTRKKTPAADATQPAPSPALPVADAPPPATVFPNIAAAAKALDVHERTLKTWLAAGCPGHAGHYDVAAIAAWHEANVGSSLEDTSERSLWTVAKIKAEAQKRQIEVDSLMGRLVDVELPAREFAAHIVEARTLLEQLPSRFLSFVPALAPAAARKSAKQRMEAAIREVLSSLENALRRQADE